MNPQHQYQPCNQVQPMPSSQHRDSPGIPMPRPISYQPFQNSDEASYQTFQNMMPPQQPQQPLQRQQPISSAYFPVSNEVVYQNANLGANIASQNKYGNLEVKHNMESSCDRNEYETLVRDFEVFKGISLIKDHNKRLDLDTLDLLFQMTPAFTENKTYLFNNLNTMYLNLYKDFFNKYSSVELYMQTVLHVLINQNVDTLIEMRKKVTRQLSNQQIKRVHTGGLPMSKRGPFINTGMRTNKEPPPPSPSPPQQQQEKQQQQPENRTVTVIHPFLESDFYKQHTLLFNLGQCYRYFIPSEFGLVVSNINEGQVTRYLSATSSQTLKGVVITFQTPLLVLISRRVVGKSINAFLEFDYMPSLFKTVAKMTDKSDLENKFQLGVRQSMNIQTLGTKEWVPYKDWGEDENHLYTTLISKIDVISGDSRYINGRSYSETAYKMKVPSGDPTLNVHYKKHIHTNNYEAIIRTYDVYNEARMKLGLEPRKMHSLFGEEEAEIDETAESELVEDNTFATIDGDLINGKFVYYE